ncbi:MAG TPA: glycosyltransferase family 4 protein, partial [Terriglobia bacterium]|nr:glycosyltransferase family 4 protein [Terriglobia bacterium]
REIEKKGFDGLPERRSLSAQQGGKAACADSIHTPEEARKEVSCGGPKGEEYFKHDRRVLLTVARMAASERYKGHEVVLRALPAVVAQIPNLTYAVVGDGDDRARLEGLAAELGLDGHVVFTGEVSDRELAAIYHRSEVFVLPAVTAVEDRSPKGEGFGIVYLEAMAFGKPVIGPSYGAPVELIRHGENGLLVDPESPSAVAQALVSLFSNHEAARDMGRAGREWVREHYSHAAFRERLGEIFGAKTGAECMPLKANRATA